MEAVEFIITNDMIDHAADEHANRVFGSNDRMRLYTDISTDSFTMGAFWMYKQLVAKKDIERTPEQLAELKQKLQKMGAFKEVIFEKSELINP
jgi:hypothetical protein